MYRRYSPYSPYSQDQRRNSRYGPARQGPARQNKTWQTTDYDESSIIDLSARTVTVTRAADPTKNKRVEKKLLSPAEILVVGRFFVIFINSLTSSSSVPYIIVFVCSSSKSGRQNRSTLSWFDFNST